MTVPVAGRGHVILAVYGLFTALTSISVGLRTYCRVWVVKSSGWDDGLAVIAWVIPVVYAQKVQYRSYLRADACCADSLCHSRCLRNLRSPPRHRSTCLEHPTAIRDLSRSQGTLLGRC